MTPRDNPLAGFEQLFEQFTGAVSDFPIDVVDSEDEIVISADLPGYSEEDISVEVGEHGRKLTLSAEKSESSDSNEDAVVVKERRNVSVKRSLMLPRNADVDSAEATYNNGVLTVSFDKVESDDGGVSITVE